MNVTPFITFEGIDGCGKTTQINLLKEWLHKSGVTAHFTREPGGCDTSETIRQLVLSPETNVGSTGELLLYLAARAEHVRQVIEPSLNDGIWVVSDRFADATFAYQGYGRGLDLDSMALVNDVATTGVIPTITFILDIDVPTSRTRIETGRDSLDRLEQSSLEFFERVRDGYLALAEKNPERIVVIDGTNTINNIHATICTHLSKYLQ